MTACTDIAAGAIVSLTVLLTCLATSAYTAWMHRR